MSDLAQLLQQYRQRVEQQLDRLVTTEQALEPRLQQTMRHGLLNGGKRLRPALVYLSHKLCSGEGPHILTDRAAVAIECVHSYSLVHDDLPAMDDDDLRRGQPTCHIAFDEASAILAGDALQCLAFEHLSEPCEGVSAALQLRMLNVLARASGERGMVAGQAFDLSHVDKPLALEQLQAMHAHKTGALITAAVELGALSACAPGEDKLELLRRYGDLIGLAFQIQDDLLDIEGDTATLGKPQGSDLAQNKPTYPALLGLEGARERLHQLHEEAVTILRGFGPDANDLIALTDYIVNRDH
ncbi:polyprenyl synthetase family protein [Marinobacterium sediminicola]|uniref:Geranylgeranyl diphosphate synthase, type II n=1 Tax=Marinobacterium sediminicola TaxID=518898 RepID=A0ABY1S1Z9_9GAMM|nr:farnesyl diphosphate synthase [Marinobacterium sediminicola]ULG69556.1 polyprenyl synthetase family protein [Marinobacterium sediminicola]SMR75709.1 geranylgeranyl diphosphate synthase, type II [Marinobacterium sediminicola]